MKIKGMLFPFENFDVDELLNHLADSEEKFIIRYSHEGKKYLQITNFEKHQKPHDKETESIIPPPTNAEKENISQVGLDNNLGYTQQQPRSYPDTTHVTPNDNLGNGECALDLDLDLDLDLGSEAQAPTPTPEKPTPPTKPVKQKHGEYGWVRLTKIEHDRLANDFGPETVDWYIKLIDERAQTNNNKYKWKDWNLVIRRAIREKWGREPPISSSGKTHRTYETKNEKNNRVMDEFFTKNAHLFLEGGDAHDRARLEGLSKHDFD